MKVAQKSGREGGGVCDDKRNKIYPGKAYRVNINIRH